MTVKKDRLISVRLPQAEYDAVLQRAEQEKMSLSEFLRLALVSASYRIELNRNRTYHRRVLSALDEIEREMEPGKRKRRAVDRRGRVKG